VFYTEFKQDVYLIDSFVCPQINPKDLTAWIPPPKKKPISECPPCNYASRSSCGVSPKEGCECDKKEVKKYCPKTKEEIEDVLISTEFIAGPAATTELDPTEWTELKANVLLRNQTSAAGKTRFYRYHHTDPTRGWRLEGSNHFLIFF
jgi:hypothetical protein